jgi:hypothetical protein
VDETRLRTMLSELADTEAPPARVDIGRAISTGRRDRRRRRAAAGGSTLAISAAVGAVVTLVAIPGSRTAGTPDTGRSGSPVPATKATSPVPATSSPSPARSPGPNVAPKQFDPLMPYASFGWLPGGYTTGGGAGPQLSMNTRSESLSAASGSTGATWLNLRVTVAGACTESGPAALPVLNCDYGDSTSGPMRATSQAAGINGRRAFWANGSDFSYLFWQYAPGAWSILEAPTKLPQWPLIAGRQAMLHQVAASVRYQDTTPIRFPYWLTGVPAGWTVSATSFEVMPSGKLLGQTLGLGPAADPGALELVILPAVPGDSCKFIAGQSQYVTLDGARAVLRTMNVPANQSLCASHVSGLKVYISLDTAVPDSNAPLPGVSGLGGALGAGQALHFLGADSANWTASPVRA